MTQRTTPRWRGRKIAVESASRSALRLLATRGEIPVFDLSAPPDALISASETARSLNLPVWGWIEVGRDPEAVAEHPEWMHLPQHHEWLEAFPEWNGSYKALVSPWLCVNNVEAFAYALERVTRLVDSSPPLEGLFLNDIQGAPVGCGCGNVLCRSWDNSPGEKIAPTPYKDPDTFFSKRFWEACVERLQEKGLSRANVVPILCGECEIGISMNGVESPDEQLGTCRGIPCSRPCALVYWPKMVRAFAEAEGGAQWKGLLTPYKLFGRDVPLYGDTAAWVGASIAHYREVEPTANLIAVVQGWDVEPEEVTAQFEQALGQGAGGVLVLDEPLDQSWTPIPLPEGYVPEIPPIMCGHNEK